MIWLKNCINVLHLVLTNVLFIVFRLELNCNVVALVIIYGGRKCTNIHISCTVHMRRIS